MKKLFAFVLILIFLVACQGTAKPVLVYRLSTGFDEPELLLSLQQNGVEIKLYGDSRNFDVNGSKVLFASGEIGNVAIWTVNTDGKNLKKIVDEKTVSTIAVETISRDGIGTYEAYSGVGLSWSPDGKKFAVAGFRKVCIFNADGTNEQCLTPKLDALNGRDCLDEDGLKIWQSRVEWSPDGSTIAVGSEWNWWAKPADGPSTKNWIFLFRLEKDLFGNFKSSSVNVVDYATYFAWSPDGSKLAYIYVHDLEPINIAMLNKLSVLDLKDMSSRDIIVIKSVDSLHYPTWSPNDKTIAVELYNSDTNISKILSVDAGTGTASELKVNFPANSWYYNLTWSGDKIIFVSLYPDRGLERYSSQIVQLDPVTGQIMVLRDLGGNSTSTFEVGQMP